MQRRVVLGTGGTIAGRSDRAGDHVDYVAGQVAVTALVEAVPALAGLALEIEQVDQIDSKDMGFALWQRLAARVAHHLAREDVAGVVITHGTDTLEETAFFLECVLRPGKPVVLTCAMRPASALVPDGPQNLLDAVLVAGDARCPGVAVVCAGEIHAARHVTKVHPYRVDAFDSGDAGPIGCVEASRVRWFHPAPAQAGAAVLDVARLRRVLAVGSLPRVEWMTSHADADGGLLEAALAHADTRPDLRPQGVVVAGTGNGTVHRSLESVLRVAKAQGVRVVRATRCSRGQVVPGALSEEYESLPLSPAKARIALALELMGLDDA
ncbi:MAG: asparaginase [Hydrogenophaga sp.]